jgi:iron complex outermembrane recepter protein
MGSWPRRLLGGFTTLAGMLVVGGAWGQEAPSGAWSVKVRFDIPREPLPTALAALGQQSGLDVALEAGARSDFVSPRVVGSYTPDEALRRILDNSGLKADYLGPRTVAIRTAQSSSGDSNQAQQRSKGQIGPRTAPEPPAPAAESAPENLQEVLVTAQKRQERLQDVPISISVLRGSDLDTVPGESLNNVISQVAGVYSFNTGQNGGTKFSIRGVTSNTSLFSGSGTVGYYLDEVPFGFVRIPVTPDADAYDMERVEVLRGPQGTLYGTNSVNGVIRIMTKDADLNQFDFKARGSGSSTQDGGDNYRADAAVNVPLIPGRLGLRMVLGYEDYSGWLDQPTKSDVNDAIQKVVRLKLNADLGNSTDLKLLGWFNRDNRGGPDIGPGDEVSYGLGSQPLTTDYDIYGLTINHDFSSFSMLSTTNHMKYASMGVLSLANGTASQTTRIGAGLTSEEVRLTSTQTGRWQWSLGAMYRDAQDEIVTGNTVQILPSDDVYHSKSYAGFGELKYVFARGLFDFTAGLRYFEDDLTLRQKSLSGVGVPVNPIRDEETFNSVTPRLVLTWHPRADLNVYASYSQGFRSGFMQTPQVLVIAPNAPPVKEDLLINYEIGAKGTFANGRVSYDAAAYYIDWRHSQQQVFAPLILGLNVAVPFNSGGISGPGADLEVDARLTDRLVLSLAGSWNGLGFDDEARAPANNALIFRAGDRPDESPETTARLGLDYTAPLGGAGFKGRVSTFASYVSGTTTHSAVTGVEVLGNSFLNAQARIALIAPRSWVVTLYGDNLTNDNPILRPATTLAFSSRVRPRTVGLQFEYQF